LSQKAKEGEDVFSRLLVAIDGSNASDKAFDAAMEPAKSLKVAEAILVVHVVPTPVPGDGISPSALAALGDAYEKEGWSLLARYGNLAKERYGIEAKEILAKGDAGRKILEVAYENKVDLVVIGHRGFGKLKEFLMGSVAHHIANNSKVSVLIIQ
jgi:nucleotide-binding universal stress UspA family protein